MTPIAAALLFGFLAALVAGLALVLVRTAAGFTRANAPLLAAFAGGIVITMALVKLLPEALHLSERAPWLVLAGFAFGFVLHAVAGAAGHGKPEGAVRRASVAAVMAIALHSALDGLVYAVSFQVDPVIGFSAASGLVLHEFPEALICFVLLQRAGVANRAALIGAFLASGATTFAAAGIAGNYTSALDSETLGALFAVVAGLLLHTGAAHLLHEAGEAGPVKGGAAVFAGAGVAAAMTLVHAPHVHPEHAHAQRPDFAAPAGHSGDHTH
ncbi:MAG: ZIP family metal transporter [Oceanicaulis sp.]